MDTIVKILMVIILVVFVGLILALPVMYLWNAVIPDVFHLERITFSQALYLNLLCSALFSSGNLKSDKD